MKKGLILINVLIFAAIAVTITIALVNWGALTFKSVRTLTQREQAFQIAEAGIDYYRWHLAHFPSDYSDGTTTPQPYVHNFEDAQGNVIGRYSLTITPPAVGSTLVTVKSKGTLVSDPAVSRIIQASLAKPSFARYAFIANDFMRFGEGTVVEGPIQVNNGVHFDGVARSTVASSLATTTDPDNNCSSPANCALEWAVFTQLGTDDPQPLPVSNPTPPFQQLNRPDVFNVGRQISAPNVSFSSITSNFNDIQQLAGSIVGAPNYTNLSSSGSSGYHIVFSYSGGPSGTTTYSLYKVTALWPSPDSTNCKNVNPPQSNWGTWSIKTESLMPSGSGLHLPANGVIFVSDNVWVDGTVGNNARITIAASTQNGTPPDIIVNHSLKYTVRDGSEVIGLIAKGNVTIGLYSDDNIEIDAAMIAQNGRVGRFYYDTNCESAGSANEWHRNSITIYGMIGTFIRYGFAYTGSNPNCSSVSSGYCTRDITYDPNLLYGPPPSFPLSSSQYVPLSWQEVQ